jgi:hypothetical protein
MSESLEVLADEAVASIAEAAFERSSESALIACPEFASASVQDPLVVPFCERCQARQALDQLFGRDGLRGRSAGRQLQPAQMRKLPSFVRLC